MASKETDRSLSFAVLPSCVDVSSTGLRGRRPWRGSDLKPTQTSGQGREAHPYRPTQGDEVPDQDQEREVAHLGSPSVDRMDRQHGHDTERTEPGTT